MKLLHQLRVVATKVRRAADHLAPLLGYAPSLAGFCPFGAVAVTEASAAVIDPVADPELHAVLVAGRCHTRCHFWTEIWLGDRARLAILDVTATQFAEPPRPIPRVRVLRPSGPAAADYFTTQADGSDATRFLLHEDADMMRVLPPRWWEVAEDPAATLDARVLATIRRHPRTVHTGIARKVRAPPHAVLESLGRLAGRPPIYGLRKRAT